VAGGAPPRAFRDRAREQGVLDLLLRDVRRGRGRALVLRGEPGVAKTTLLSYLADHALGCRVVRSVEAEAGSRTAFATLHQICAPLSVHLDRLPTAHRAALSAALAQNACAPPGHLPVGLATLSLFAAAAADEPLVCVVDDAQRIDRMSAAMLAFVARRLEAVAVGLVFALNTSVSTAVRRGPLAGLPELCLDGGTGNGHQRSRNLKLDEEVGGQP
jgi:predicted ATPase